MKPGFKAESRRFLCTTMTLPRRGSDHGSRGDTSQPAVSIEIPFTSHGGEAEVIEIVYDELNDDIDDVLQVLKEEKAKLHYWVSIAQECYRRRYFKAFEKLLDIARAEANVDYDKSEEDRVSLTSGRFILSEFWF